ncbi:hypothetical protein GCM10009863_41750 [Streptomyces axinellae]|uniref:Uncharacterized protein n=1 Tax=Streptomyces axinellae TaxID=552788 RepID=A0ABN3QCV1_9ACTN
MQAPDRPACRYAREGQLMPGKWNGMWTRRPLPGERPGQVGPPQAGSDSDSESDPLLLYAQPDVATRQESELHALTTHWENLGFHGLPNGTAEDDRVRRVAEARVEERRPSPGANIPALIEREASDLNAARSAAVAAGRGHAQAGARLMELRANAPAQPPSPLGASDSGSPTDSDAESFDFDDFPDAIPDGPLEGIRELRQAAYGRASPAQGRTENADSSDSYAVRPPPPDRLPPLPPPPNRLPPLPPPPNRLPPLPPPPNWVPPPPPPPPVTPPPPPRSPYGRGGGRGGNPGQGSRPGQRRGHGSR